MPRTLSSLFIIHCTHYSPFKVMPRTLSSRSLSATNDDDTMDAGTVEHTHTLYSYTILIHYTHTLYSYRLR
jgi:hypothetical protein